MDFPPPHYLLFEPLNDRETLKLWNEYKVKYGNNCEFDEIDGCKFFRQKNSHLYLIRGYQKFL